MQYVNVWCLAVGKFLNGLFVTVVHMAQLKMVNETVPVYLLEKYGTAVQILSSVGYFFLFSLGRGLPLIEYNPDLARSDSSQLNTRAYHALLNNEFWRTIFFIPCIINLLMLFIFHLFIKEDSIMFNVSNNNDK